MSSVPPRPDDDDLRRDCRDREKAVRDRLLLLILEAEARGDMRLVAAFRDAYHARLTESEGEPYVRLGLDRSLADAFARGAAVIFDAAYPHAYEPSARSRRYAGGDTSLLAAAGLPAASLRLIERGDDPSGPPAVLLDLVAGGKVGVVVAPTLAHLGRDAVKRDSLLDRLGEANTLLLLRGAVYDLRDPGVRLALMTDDACRAVRQSARARVRNYVWVARARALAVPCPLGPGLVWASPEDPAYRACVDTAGLSGWLNAVPDRHRERWVKDGTAYYVLPFPDAAVVRAVHLGMQWLLDTQSVSAVLDLIRGGADGWPVPGAVPRHTPGRWVAAANDAARWEPATLDLLRRLLGHPSVFGTFDLNRRVGDWDGSPASSARVIARGAFPSFAAPELERSARAALRVRRPAGDGSIERGEG